MIRAEPRNGSVTLAADLPRRSLAYIDRDWIPAGGGSVPALVLSPDGTLSWCGSHPRVPLQLADPDTAAALFFLAFAREAVAAVENVTPASVEAIGSGIIARLARALLERSALDAPPLDLAHGLGAVIDTTGDPRAIGTALGRLADLGTLALAGEPRGRKLSLDLYPDLHVRGLTLVGVAPSLSSALRVDESDPLLALAVESLAVARPGAVLPLAAPWLRLEP